MKPSGGLLGGAPKMSKLAALAAAKKKEAEEKRKPSESKEVSAETSRAVSLLDRLVTKKDSTVETSSSKTETPVITNSKLAFRKKPPVQKKSEPVVSESAIEETIPARPKQNLRAPPSSFAQALLGSQDDTSSGGGVMEDSQPPIKRRRSVIASFGLPYAESKIFTAADPFSKPSPDDVVLNAQSKATFR